jgi:hypothetical protein
MTYKKGDRIKIDCNGRTVDGLVTLASPNSISLMLEFDAMLGGHAGKMPVTMRDASSGFSIIDGTEVAIRKMEA